MAKKIQFSTSWETKDFLKKLRTLKDESFNKWADQAPTFRVRGKEHTSKCNVVRVLSFPEVSPSGQIDFIKCFGYTHNLVTDDGEIYYANRAANETPAANENFLTGRFEMGTTGYVEAETDDFSDFDVAGTSKVTCSRIVYTACYPKRNDTGDADNTGDGVDVVSYSVNYTTGQSNDCTIEQGTIHDNACPGACTSLLAVFSFCSFAKTACDALKIFVNHAFENQ